MRKRIFNLILLRQKMLLPPNKHLIQYYIKYSLTVTDFFIKNKYVFKQLISLLPHILRNFLKSKIYLALENTTFSLRQLLVDFSFQKQFHFYFYNTYRCCLDGMLVCFSSLRITISHFMFVHCANPLNFGPKWQEFCTVL